MKQFKNLLVLIFFAMAWFSFAQEKENIIIEYAGQLFTDQNIEEGAKVFVRDNP